MEDELEELEEEPQPYHPLLSLSADLLDAIAKHTTAKDLAAIELTSRTRHGAVSGATWRAAAVKAYPSLESIASKLALDDPDWRALYADRAKPEPPKNDDEAYEERLKSFVFTFELSWIGNTEQNFQATGSFKSGGWAYCDITPLEGQALPCWALEVHQFTQRYADVGQGGGDYEEDDFRREIGLDVLDKKLEQHLRLSILVSKAAANNRTQTIVLLKDLKCEGALHPDLDSGEWSTWFVKGRSDDTRRLPVHPRFERRYDGRILEEPVRSLEVCPELMFNDANLYPGAKQRSTPSMCMYFQNISDDGCMRVGELVDYLEKVAPW